MLIAAMYLLLSLIVHMVRDGEHKVVVEMRVFAMAVYIALAIGHFVPFFTPYVWE